MDASAATVPTRPIDVSAVQPHARLIEAATALMPARSIDYASNDIAKVGK